MAIKRKHIKRSSPLRRSSIIVPIYRPGIGVDVHLAAVTIKDSSNFQAVGTDFITANKAVASSGLLITHASGASGEQVTWGLAGYNQFGEAVTETGLVTDNSPTSAESVHAYSYVSALTIDALEATAATGSQTVALGHSGAAAMKIGIPAKIDSASELLGVIGSVHGHTADENCDGRNLSIENVELNQYTFTLESSGTSLAATTIGGVDADIILWCVFDPNSSAL